jgi:DNA-directed RNA polymerase specialized sigma54-like protein
MRQYWPKKAFKSIAEAWESEQSTFACTAGSRMSFLVEKLRQRLKQILLVVMMMMKKKKDFLCDCGIAVQSHLG